MAEQEILNVRLGDYYNVIILLAYDLLDVYFPLLYLNLITTVYNIFSNIMNIAFYCC